MEFVATLPSGMAEGTRPTNIVVDEICRGSRRSLLLMGYQVRTSSGIHECLNSAAARGVAVTLICDREDNGWREVYRDWLAGTAKPKVMLNPPGTGADILGKMHCKVLCSDERDLLITSANFTWRGMNANIEYGVRLVDPKSGRQAIEFVQHLGREGLLVPAVA
jgi:phosphatidylserine/phosphatidylglycerophosphate/cardiolipin synthase-like enzyme